jgi:hypothetical protein
MPPQLLPASAAAFKPRASSVHVVLGSKVERWVTDILRHVAHVKRLGKSVQEHQRCLTEILSSPHAIWMLSSIMMPKAPDADLWKDSNPLVEALFNYKTIHIEAYIVHVDLVLQNEVAFKLTPDSIESLIEYHRDDRCSLCKYLSQQLRRVAERVVGQRIAQRVRSSSKPIRIHYACECAEGPG